jgi:hypothetical protein
MRWSRAVVPLLAGAAGVAGLVATVALVADGGRGTPEARSGGRLDDASGIRATPGLPSRVDPTQAVVAERIFVYGGRSPDAPLGQGGLLDDAVLVDPRTGAVVPLPSPPFAAPLWDAEAVATPDRVFLIGRECTVGPDFDPEGDVDEPDCRPGTYAAAELDVAAARWTRRSIPEALRRTKGADALVRALGIATDGRVVLGLGRVATPEIWTVAGEDWQRVADPGASMIDGCVTGNRVVVLNVRHRRGDEVTDADAWSFEQPGEPVTGFDTDGYVEPRVAVLDLEGSADWRASPPAKVVRYRDAPPRVVCLGNQAMAVGRSGIGPASVARFDLDAVEPLGVAAPPVGEAMPSAGRAFAGEVWTGAELVFLPISLEGGSPTLAYRPSTDSWRTLSGLPAITDGAMWNGVAIVGYAPATWWRQATNPDAPPQRSAGGVFQVVNA